MGASGLLQRGHVNFDESALRAYFRESSVSLVAALRAKSPDAPAWTFLGGPDNVAFWSRIRVKDNGMGVPQKVLDKIFQPFFTTKPVGEGTGLGLSLSYDIIKAHGGELKVETKEGEGAEFIIILPV